MTGSVPAPVGLQPDLADRTVAFLRRRPVLVPGILGAVGATLLAYATWQDPNADGAFPQCAFREATGLDCVGCGGLRAVHALTHGHLLVAADHNLFVAALVPAAVVAWLLWLRRARGGPPSPLSRVPWQAWIALLVGAVVFGVVRNIDGGAPFDYLGSSA